MSQSDQSVTFNQDASTPDLLHSWLERLCVSERESLFRVLEQASDLPNDFDESRGVFEEVSFHAAREQMRIDLLDEVSRLTTQEAFVFRRWIAGATISEIACELNERLPIVSRQLKVLQKRLLSRLSKEDQLGTTTAPASRLDVFAELQRRLGLTSAKAAEWQAAAHEARR